MSRVVNVGYPFVTDAITIVKNCIAPAGIRTRVLWFLKETSALPNELKGIPSSRVSIKQLVRTNTCDTLAIMFRICKLHILQRQGGPLIRIPYSHVLFHAFWCKIEFSCTFVHTNEVLLKHFQTLGIILIRVTRIQVGIINCPLLQS